MDDGNPDNDNVTLRYFSEATSSIPTAFADFSQRFTVVFFLLELIFALPLIASIRNSSRAPPAHQFSISFS
jgi:hypothetical protein